MGYGMRDESWVEDKDEEPVKCGECEYWHECPCGCDYGWCSETACDYTRRDEGCY